MHGTGPSRPASVESAGHESLGTLALDPLDGPVQRGVVRWPLVLDRAADFAPTTDPWAGLVRASIEDYSAGRHERASLIWDEAIVWRVTGRGPMSGHLIGRDAIFDYHRRLSRSTDGSFGQRLLALRSSGGPIVQVDVRTTARLGDRHLDIPTLILFEVRAFRVRRVTELPADQLAWDRFWDG